jgi:TM2 domain-containing membrane protein YozV
MGETTLGKMKGNRLNTAANVGSFVSSRQQLKQQKQIASNTGQMSGDMNAMLQIQQKQALEADYDRLLARMDRAVAEGRMTRDEADTATELEWFNRLNPAPQPNNRIVATIGATLERSGTPEGWYIFREQGQSLATAVARYWTGAGWTMQTMSLSEAKQIEKQKRLAITAEGNAQKSRVTAGVLGILLGSIGVHRFYLGSTGMGILMVIAFFGLMIFGAFWVVTIWGIVEGIMILAKTKVFDRDAKGVPLK